MLRKNINYTPEHFQFHLGDFALVNVHQASFIHYPAPKNDGEIIEVMMPGVNPKIAFKAGMLTISGQRKIWNGVRESTITLKQQFHLDINLFLVNSIVADCKWGVVKVFLPYSSYAMEKDIPVKQENSSSTLEFSEPEKKENPFSFDRLSQFLNLPPFVREDNYTVKHSGKDSEDEFFLDFDE